MIWYLNCLEDLFFVCASIFFFFRHPLCCIVISNFWASSRAFFTRDLVHVIQIEGVIAQRSRPFGLSQIILIWVPPSPHCTIRVTVNLYHWEPFSMNLVHKLDTQLNVQHCSAAQEFAESLVLKELRRVCENKILDSCCQRLIGKMNGVRAK